MNTLAENLKLRAHNPPERYLQHRPLTAVSVTAMEASSFDYPHHKVAYDMNVEITTRVLIEEYAKHDEIAQLKLRAKKHILHHVYGEFAERIQRVIHEIAVGDPQAGREALETIVSDMLGENLHAE